MKLMANQWNVLTVNVWVKAVTWCYNINLFIVHQVKFSCGMKGPSKQKRVEKEKEAETYTESRGTKRGHPYEWTEEKEKALLKYLHSGEIAQSKIHSAIGVPEGAVRARISKLRKEGALASIPSSESCTAILLL